MVQTLKNVLILGGNGFVGKSFKNSEMFNKSFKTYYSDRKDTDLTKYDQVESLFQNVQPEIILNCAGKSGGIVATSSNPYSYLSENLKIYLNIYEAIKKLKCVDLINLGSSAMYPKDSPIPIKESSLMAGNLEESNSHYSLSKIVGIELGKALNTKTINVKTLIPTNLYGPHDNFDPLYSNVVPGLIRKIHEAKVNNMPEYVAWGSGEPFRELLYVDDLINAVTEIIQNNLNSSIINIGSGEEIRIKDLVFKICEIIGYDGNIVFDKSKPDGIYRKTLDSSIINNLGWNPTTNLDKGLKITYKWLTKNLV